VQHIRELQRQGLSFRLYLVGNKAINFFRRSNFPIARTFPNIGQTPSSTEAAMIADELVAPFLAEEIDRVDLVYTRFVSLISSRPTVQTLLPLDPGALSQDNETFRLTSRGGSFEVSRERANATPTGAEFAPDTIFEQEPVQLLDALLPLYLNSQVLRALQEATASELASRMTAMSAASDNANKLLSTLTIVYNKARQAAITQEILEVVAGANA